jgi:hypothetical protein
MAKKKWRSFEEAREYARRLGLKSGVEWYEWAKTDQKPADIPATPYKAYKDKWQGMGDWLGTGNLAPGKWEFRSFEEARAYARGLKLRGEKEWREWCKAKTAAIVDLPLCRQQLRSTRWEVLLSKSSCQESSLASPTARAKATRSRAIARSAAAPTTARSLAQAGRRTRRSVLPSRDLVPQ